MKEVFQIIKSLIFTTSISIIFSFLAVIISMQFFPEANVFIIGWSIFILTFIIQFIISYILSERRITAQNSINESVEQIAMEYASAYQEIINNQSTPVYLSCAYCQTQQYAELSFIKENVFQCHTCNQKNKVYINIRPVRTTTPLEGDLHIQEIKMPGDEKEEKNE